MSPEALKRIKELLEQGQEKKADEFYKKNRNCIKLNTFLELKRDHIKTVIEAQKVNYLKDLEILLKQFRFKKSDEKWNIRALYPSEYSRLKTEYFQKFFVKELKPLFEDQEYKTADQLWFKAGKPFKEIYDLLKKKSQKESYLKNLEILLKQFRFKESDEKWKSLGAFPRSDYEILKSGYIEKYFGDEFHLVLDKQQSVALANTSDALLVTARAGSGKTRTLTAKAALLANKYHIDPNHILLLAFNTDAAKEMKSRISEMCPGLNFNNVRTFHSLACGILERPDLEQNPDRFVINAIKGLLSNDDDFKKGMYQYFRNDIANIETGLTDEEYISIRDKGISIVDGNSVYISLGGRYVKSRAEKWIADFFFEHDLSLDGHKVWNAYEKPHRNFAEVIKPDFTIGKKGQNYSFILEHWAIDDMSFYPDKPIWKNGTMTFRGYNDLREKKRSRFNNELELIETYPKDMENGREEFENILKRKFEDRGIQYKKKKIEELREAAFSKAENRLNNLFLSFIQKCSQKQWTVGTAHDKITEYPCKEIEKVFLNAAVKVYSKYWENFKSPENGELEKYDYSMLLPAATALVTQDCQLKLKYYDGEEPDDSIKAIKVRDIKYILVDEYQDFSQLFYNFIKAIKDHSGTKLFCVGDDWQAINGFAGSELKFFGDFKDYYEKNCPGQCNISTNYRSFTSIVDAGNCLMSDVDKDKKAVPSKKEKGGVGNVYIDDFFVDYSNENNSQEDNIYITRYPKQNSIDTKASMTLKVVHKILSKSENIEILKRPYDSEKDNDARCMILTRKNYLHSFGAPTKKNDSEERDKLIEGLIECFITRKQFNHNNRADLRKKIVRKTVHKAKGEQAEIVIILNCCQREFPMLHPDNKLFRLFGITDGSVLKEEKRLFYVAVTRAKRKVYLVTEKDRESDFLGLM